MSANKKKFVISVMLMAIIFPVMSSAADYTWTGATDNNWSEPGNWTSVPTGTYPASGTDKAVIPGGKANYPVLNQSLSVGDLLIEKGASLIVNTSIGGFYVQTSATVNGSLSLESGIFNANKNTVGDGGIITISGGSLYIGLNGLIINSGGTIALNSGEIVFNSNGALENNGNVRISGGSVKNVYTNQYCAITNNSLLEITGSASGENWSFANSPGGVFELKPGSMLNISSDNGGKFDNYGTVTGNGLLKFTPSPSTRPTFKNFGTIKPGGPLNVGWITIEDKYEQMPEGKLEIEIFGSAVYDKLTVNGDAVFHGTLAVIFLPGAVFGTDEIYDIVSYTGTHFGTSFSSAVLPPLPGYHLGPVDYNVPGFVKLPIRNSPPTTSGIPPLLVNEDEAPSSLKLSVFFNDTESGPSGLTYTIQPDANPKPFTASISGENLAIAYTPDANGIAKLIIRAKDPGGLYVDADLNVSVNPVNDKPVFVDIGNPPAADEDAGLQTINWVTSFSPGPPNESDQKPTYIIRNVSNTALFSKLPEINGNGTLTYIAVPETSGTSDFEVAVNDKGGTTNGGVDTSDFRKITIIIAPVNDAPRFESLNPPEVNEDAERQIITGWAKFTPGPPDEVAQKSVYSVINISNKALFSEVPQIDGNGTLTYKPAVNAFGISTFDVLVKDDGGIEHGGKEISEPQTFTVSVKAVNDPPLITGQKPLSAVEGTPFTVEANHLVIADPDNIFPDDFKVTLYKGDNYILKADAKDTFISDPYFIGQLTVPVRVNDIESESEIFYLSVTVKSENRPPVAGSGNALDINDQKQWISVNSSPSLQLGNLLTFEAWVKLNPKSASGSDSDTDHTILSKGNEYLFGISEADINTDGIPDGRVFVGPPDKLTFLTLSDNMTQEYNRWRHVAVTFDGVNLILYLDGKRIGEEIVETYNPSADSSPLTICGRISAEGIVTGILNGMLDEVRIWNVVRTESDIRKDMYRKVSKEDESYLAGYWQFDLDTDTVVFDSSGNRNNGILNSTGATAPTPWVKSDCYESRRVKEDSALNIFAGYDPDNDSLSISLTALPLNGSLSSDDNRREITYTPNPDWNGEDSFTYQLSDGNPSDTYTVRIRVEAENDPPVFESEPVVSVNEGETYQYDIKVSDPDSGDHLTIIALEPLPDWLELNQNSDGTARLEGKPENKDVGEYPISLQVIDAQSETVSQTFTIFVENVNNAPILDTSKDIVLDSIIEDISESDNIGILISDMIADATITDTDADALQGIAVIATDNRNGIWQYAKNGDTDFIAFPSDIAENKAVLLNGNIRLRFVPNKNYYGTSDIAFRAWDQAYGSNGDTGADTANNGGMTAFSINTAKAVIEVKAVNDAPIANNDAYSAAEDSPLNIDRASGLLSNDSDIENDALTVIRISDPVSGALTLNSDGSFEYLPNENFFGEDSFTYKINDGAEDSNTATVVISVGTVNDNPSATDDSFSVEEDEVLMVTSPGVLKNDSDTEGNSLKAVKIGECSYGSVTLNSDGSFIYRPNADFFGEDSFTYKANDGITDSNTATVRISVTAVNDAPSISGTPETQVNENSSYLFIPGAEDIDKDALTFSIVNKPNWAAFDTTNGTLSGTPDNEDVGTNENIVISVSDGTTTSSLPAFNLTVVNVNDAPSISGTPTKRLNEGSSYSFTPKAEDSDGDVLTFSIVNKPDWAAFDTTSGTLSGMPHNEDVGTSENIVIGVSDGILTAALQAFDIAVIRIIAPPDANDDRYETEEDQPLTIQAPGVLANDSGIEGDYRLSIGDSLQGRITLKNDGSFSYTPAENYNGEERFTYNVIKGNETDTATITISVKPVNDSPVLNKTELRLSPIAEDASDADNTGMMIADLLADDPISDADKDAKSGIAVIGADTAHGFWQYANPVVVNFPEDIGEDKAVLLDTMAMIRFVPDPDFNGTATITFRAWDQTQGNSGDINSNTTIHGGTTAFSSDIGRAVITVNPVNDKPIFTSIPITTAVEDSSYSYTITTADPDAEDIHSITATTLPDWLSLSDQGDGTAILSGTPNNSNVGIFDVVLNVEDTAGASNTQSFTIRITNVNNPPEFISAPVVVATEGEKYAYVIEIADLDADDMLLITAPMLPAWLSLTDNGNGTALLSGTPDNGDVGEHTIKLSVRDAAGVTASQNFTIAVANVNSPPKFTGTPVIAASENREYIYFITTTDFDAEDSLSITISALPKWLSLTDKGDGTARLSGTPTNGDVGEHSISLIVKDTAGETDTQNFTISVTNVNEPPIFSSTPVTDATEDATYIYSITSSDADAGDTLTISALKIPGWLSLTDNKDGTAKLSGIPGDSDIGFHSIVLEVRDTAGAAGIQTFEITVVNVNDAPIITAQNTLSTSEETAITLNLNDLTVSDPDNVYPDDFMLTVQNGANYTHNGNTIIPATSFSGTLIVPVKVNDGTDDSNSFDLNIAVSPVVVHTRAISGRITGLAAGNTIEITVSSLSTDFSKKITLQGTGDLISYIVSDVKPASDYRIEIRSENYLYSEYADFIDVAERDADHIDFSLIPVTTVISGKLVFPENAAPGESVRIEAFSESTGSMESVQIVFQNLREISYTITGLSQADDYIVSVWSDTYSHRYYDGTAAGTANEKDAKLLNPSDAGFSDISFELELIRDGSIQGIISDEAGNPVSGIEIKAWSESRQEGNSVLSNTDGSYDIKGLPESSDYTVSVVPDPSLPYLSQEKTGISTGDRLNFILKQKVSPNIPPVITAQKILEIEEGISLTIRLDDLSITDPDNVFPDDFRLRIREGENYTYSDNTIKPAPGFYGSLTIPAVVNDGVNDSNVFYLEVKVSRKPNTPPIADAGADQTVNEGEVVTLDGSKSFDSDDGIVSYFWEQVGIQSVSLSDSTAIQTTFIASDTKSEELLFQLTVTDTAGQSSRDTCIVNIVGRNNTPPDIPFAVSPTNEAVLSSESVMLQAGAFSDPDGDVHAATHWLIRRADREYCNPSFDYIAESGDLTRHTVTGLISGMKYAWKVGYKDAGAEEFSWSEEYVFKVGPLESDATVRIDPGDKAPDYRMVSFPLWPDNPASEAVLGDDLGGNYDRNNFRIGDYHPEIGNYVEYGNQLEIEPGRAYWFLARNGMDITVTGVPVSVTTDVDVRLRYDSLTGNGWNMIGCPNDADYYWNDVEILVCDGDGLILYGPVAISDLPEPNPYIDKRLWRWENGDYASDTEWIEPYKGYWVKAKAENVSLGFPASGTSDLETRIGKRLNRLVSNLQFSILDFRLREAVAYVYDDDDSPPRPMENLTLGIVKENGSSRVEASAGCFISDSADSSQPFPTVIVLLLMSGAAILLIRRN